MSTITEKQHPSHPHPLTLMRVETPYCCRGCKNEGCFEPYCYQCRGCGFYLHEACFSGSQTLHPFFKQRFLFSDKSSTDQKMHAGFCVACGKSVEGSRYHSLSPPAFLHPSCLKLPPEMTDVDQGVILKLTKKISWPSKCLKCDSRKLLQGVRGWAYESTCGHYRYHVACVKDLILEKWREAYFQQQSDSTTVSLVVEHGDLMMTGTGRKARKLSSQKIKWVLQLIITAIFGEGISVIFKIASGIFDQAS